jgi:heme/copper-type cytochrome/quinol oxidase subunit 2
VRLLLRSADGEHCFAVDALRIEKRIEPGRATRVELTPDRVGTLTFYCCLEPGDERQRGRLVVGE